jgi:TetR/AcrR family transcriptional repressor of bet genes
MRPIRQEQICRAAARVIARKGFAGTTMRMIAEEAEVSTGLLNHYFANRQDLLTRALERAFARAEARVGAAVVGLPPGRERLTALLDGALAEDEEAAEAWRVWINAYGEAVRLPELRSTIETHRRSWHALIEHALEGLLPSGGAAIPWSWRVEAMLNGLMIQVLTAPRAPRRAQVRDEIIGMLLPDLASTGEAGSRFGRRIVVHG